MAIRRPWIAGHMHLPDVYTFLTCSKIWRFSMAVSPSFNIGPINTKLENVANFNVLFLTIWV